ncbi:hypothetical protein RhiXN_11444 [Rhizoctonia solani]|uniref:Uncharacterized protein n=1 Tax=Rhizoctonia solani TaxID=456999 RepID=A0A8H8P585_9AGAM|nr:uncharacterized protein RhiXN_11444 [Rhizoctonia solani]QRW24532.1 hypothetical protein RhiXN_11444 [Rhizoctonia solani]
MPDTLLSLSGDMCSSQLCGDYQPNSNSDLDLDGPTDKNAAWAGIAVVVVVVARSRGGHDSVATGANKSTRFAWAAFWPRRRTEQSVESGPIDESNDKQQQRDSLASNLKRTPIDTSSRCSPIAKLSPRLKHPDPGQYPMLPLHHSQLQSTETLTSLPPESHNPSPNPRVSLSSSHRSSGSSSRIDIPPPGLGPPIYQSLPLAFSLAIAHSPSTPSSPPPPPPSQN